MVTYLFLQNFSPEIMNFVFLRKRPRQKNDMLEMRTNALHRENKIVTLII